LPGALVTALLLAGLAQGQTQLVVSPTSLTLTANSFGAFSYQCISLTSSDGRVPDSIPYSVSYNAVSPPGTWLQPEEVPVSNAPTAPITICVHFVYSFPPAGAYFGNVTITSSIAPTVVVPVTVVVGDAPAIISVLNGASFASAANGVSPGEIISIFGINLGPATPRGPELDSTGKVSTSLGGVQVLFPPQYAGSSATFAAPLTYVSATQINCVVPYEVRSATIIIEVSYLGQTSTDVFVVSHATSTAAAIFTETGTGTGQAAALNSDGTRNTTSNPAPAGSIVSVYMTGEGQTSPGGVDGSVTCSNGCATTSQIPTPLSTVTALVGGQPATVEFYGEAPELVSGAMQVNVLVPPNTPSGTTSLAITVSSPSQSGVTIAVR
jgi:uncharacterized protein (TIGR03437 family)